MWDTSRGYGIIGRHVTGLDTVIVRSTTVSCLHRVCHLYAAIDVISQHDSVGDTEVFKRGDLQITFASTGLASATVSIRFLRIRSNPSSRTSNPRVSPGKGHAYFVPISGVVVVRRHFIKEEKRPSSVGMHSCPARETGVSDTREAAGGPCVSVLSAPHQFYPEGAGPMS